ncbi:AtpC F0F1-type ATP synthase, epsilon subunit (mitochondrial delta subunit) [Paracoccaceae bacterium]|jgi:F-type H+-transporting ATPase subunit epsilon
MAQTVQFDLVSPERRLASFAATEVQIPGQMGDMTAMEGHAPTITGLRPGILRVIGTEGTKSYVVTGGFAEISATSVSVLAELAVPLDELTPAKLDALVADACEAAAVNTDRDAADKAVADLHALRATAFV